MTARRSDFIFVLLKKYASKLLFTILLTNTLKPEFCQKKLNFNFSTRSALFHWNIDSFCSEFLVHADLKPPKNKLRTNLPPRFKLTTSPPCDTLRAWQNLHWDAVWALCWAAIRRSRNPRPRRPSNPSPQPPRRRPRRTIA